LKGKDRETRESEVVRLEGEVRAACSELTTHSEALDAIRREILEVAGTEDPAAEAIRVEAKATRLEGDLAAAQRAEQEAGKHLDQAACTVEACEREASGASTQAEESREAAAAALAEASFASAAEARS
jgi:hypothetical protein